DGIRDATVTGVQTCALPIWLLLAAAVDRAESANHRSGVHADDFARRKTFLNDSNGALVIAMAENGNNHGLVPDVKVRVARGKPRSEERRVGKARGDGWSTEE